MVVVVIYLPSPIDDSELFSSIIMPIYLHPLYHLIIHWHLCVQFANGGSKPHSDLFHAVSKMEIIHKRQAMEVVLHGSTNSCCHHYWIYLTTQWTVEIFQRQGNKLTLFTWSSIIYLLCYNTLVYSMFLSFFSAPISML